MGRSFNPPRSASRSPVYSRLSRDAACACVRSLLDALSERGEYLARAHLLR